MCEFHDILRVEEFKRETVYLIFICNKEMAISTRALGEKLNLPDY